MRKSLTGESVVLMPSNARLIERCQDGNQAAWSTLVNRYERLVYGVALGEGLQSEIAAEVAQHTFVELHRCLTAIREPERLAGWLTVVCRRESWRQRSRVLPTVELREEELSPHPDFAEPYANAVVLYDAIQSLAEPCRSLILGLFFDPDEPDYASLAVALGRPVGSIGPMRGRCLEQLREILDSSRMAVFDNE